MAKLNKKTLKELERIAMRASYTLQQRGGIDGRSNDDEDFPEISVLAIQAMLEEAYNLGRRDGHKDCWKAAEKEA